LIFLPLVFFEPITAWYPNLFAAGKMLVAQERISSISNIEDESHHFQASLLERVKELSVRDLQVSWGKNFMKPVSFTITPGNSITLRGPSGVGKTTLALGLLGALPYRGSATVNGCEISSISNLSQILSGSLQQGHVFNTSIRENLKIADQSASDVTLLRILELVELSDISLDTVVGEFGRPLSGGEAKRLGLARALLSPAAILILDEPTEHLDLDLAERIEKRVLAEFSDRILLIITHSGWGLAGRTITLARE
jgi:ABC-type transport system involved in cytochrome bd biosynthesis fused ATPase/permease subunit